jgi:hypothetical protein
LASSFALGPGLGEPHLTLTPPGARFQGIRCPAHRESTRCVT